MKLLVSFFIFFLPFVLEAQLKHALAEAQQPADRLLKVGSNTVIIHPLDLRNEAQKWTSFDSTLKVTSVKKLVTPYGKNIIRQTYLECEHAIIRVDQYLAEGELQISAYVFDLQGNIILRKDIQDTAAPERKILPSPYYVLQSPDKQTVSLVQAMVKGGERMYVSSINFSPELKIISNKNHILSFDPESLDMYMPMVNNNGYVLLFIADKFDSYKLGSTLNCYLLHDDAAHPESVPFDFERKKIKGLRFNLSSDTLFFSALFSGAAHRKDIVGVLHGGIEISSRKKMPVKENFFNGDSKKTME